MSTITDLNYPEKLKLRIRPKKALNLENRKIRVCMIIDSFDAGTKGDGGAESQLLTLIPALVEMNCRVLVITRWEGSGKRVERFSKFLVHRLNARNRLVFGVALFLSLIKNRNDYDLLHIHTPNLAAFVGALAGFLLKRPVLVKNRGVSEFEHIRKTFRGRFRIKLMDLWYANWLVLNKEGERLLVELGVSFDKIYHGRNGVDTSLYQPIDSELRKLRRAEAGLKEDAFVVTFVGRMIKIKQVDVLIRAWAKVCKQIPDAVLLLIGEGEEKDALQNLVQRIGVDENVWFIGKVLAVKVAGYLQFSDISVLPSRSEGMSNAMLEAMSVGLPVVATSVGSAPEIIKHRENGLLINCEGDIESELAEALKMLGRDLFLHRSLSKKARKHIVEKYAIDRVAVSYRNLYSRLLEKQR